VLLFQFCFSVSLTYILMIFSSLFLIFAFSFKQLKFIKPFLYKTRMQTAKPRMKMITMIAAIIPILDEPVS